MRTIWVTWSFIGFHCYPLAPDDVEYLSHKHRHQFNVRVEIAVDDEQDRELEFHEVLRDLKADFNSRVNDQDTGSCEAMCNALHRSILIYYPRRHHTVTVDEDHECGSTLST
jgi:hypothetical protein